MKWFVIVLGLVGCFFLINAYAPSLWFNGFMVGATEGVPNSGHKIPWALPLLFGFVIVTGYKLKS